ncbi:hypothetical protein [Methanoregula sp.]|uniref:hypothetical protein n=1 Tax=Methanoregula sp. TaxID=2052170 RepID=UPI003BB06D21
MILGVDFDNTIVCYDHAFYRGALAKGLIPPSIPPAKNEIRNYLRKNGQEEAWTQLQGFVYGACMREAEPFTKVIEFFHTCRQSGIAIFIISHKTKYPYLGERYDLHKASLDWITRYDLFNDRGISISDNVFLELTKEEKIMRIKKQGCTHFIDDLPEFLSEPAFPRDVQRILFDPHDLHVDADADLRVKSWSELFNWLSKQNPT